MADWLIRPNIKTSAEMTIAEIKFCKAIGTTRVIKERLKVWLKLSSIVDETTAFIGFGTRPPGLSNIPCDLLYQNCILGREQKQSKSAILLSKSSTNCRSVVMVSELEVFSDLSERLNYNLPDFPLYVRKGRLRHFDRFAAACHWHPDLEYILVLDSSMEYFVNGKILHLAKDDGIFVNSKRLHYGFSADKTDCSFIVVVVHPSLLGEGIGAGKMYLTEKFGTN